MKITLNDLTAEQKLRLLCGKDFWHNEDLNGKLPCLHMTDASMGVRMPDESNDWNGKPSVAYPSLQMLANSWNTETVKKYAECVADDCLDAGADIVMLDNMSPENMAEAVKMAKGRAETECSGNVTRENISRLIRLGVDYISSGALTHSAPILDISLKNLHPIE